MFHDPCDDDALHSLLDSARLRARESQFFALGDADAGLLDGAGLLAGAGLLDLDLSPPVLDVDLGLLFELCSLSGSSSGAVGNAPLLLLLTMSPPGLLRDDCGGCGDWALRCGARGGQGNSGRRAADFAPAPGTRVVGRPTHDRRPTHDGLAESDLLRGCGGRGCLELRGSDSSGSHSSGSHSSGSHHEGCFSQHCDFRLYHKVCVSPLISR
jgi:hypothetical protein